MKTGIFLIVIGLIVLLVLPPFLDGQIRKRQNKKSAKMLCTILGYLFIAWGAWNALESIFF